MKYLLLFGHVDPIEFGLISSLGVFLAQTVEAGPVVNLVQFGVLGIFVVLFIVRKIVAGIEVERLEARLKDKEELIEQLYGSMKNELVPALTQNTIALGRATELITEMSIRLARRKTT